MAEAYKIYNCLIPVVVALEALIGGLTFMRTFEKRKLFRFRLIVFTVGLCALIVWVNILYETIVNRDYVYGQAGALFDSIYNLCLYTSIFVLLILIFYGCYKQPFYQILYAGSSGYIVQHIARNIVFLIMAIPWIPAQTLFSLLLMLFLDVIVYPAVLFAVYRLIIKNWASADVSDVNSKGKTALSVIVVVICIVMTRITRDYTEFVLSRIGETIYGILCGVLVLYINYSLNKSDVVDMRYSALNELVRSERKQYELSKDTIELINIKCHDIKHQISGMRETLSENSIREMESLINIYDCTVKTGNKIIDILLTEKKLICEKHDIQLSCMVDGGLLSYMESSDLYSLFGNALSNAIESVSQLENTDKRCVVLKVCRKKEMISVHVENYFAGELIVKDGLPVTLKDERYHGFGIKSMLRTVEKYDGSFCITTNGDIFNLDILLPFHGE